MTEKKRDRMLVSGVPQELREAALAAAGGKFRLGAWLTDLIRRELERPKGEDQVTERFRAIENRLDAVEARLPPLSAKSPRRPYTGKARRNASDQQRAEMRALRAEGLSYPAIAARVGVHSSTVKRTLHRA